MRDTSRGQTAGYTLTELVFTLVLLGILASLAVPAMSGYYKRTQIDSALNQLARDVFYARMVAVRAGEFVRMRFDTPEADECVSEYRIVVTSDTDGAERLAKRVDMEDEARGLCLQVRLPNGFGFTSRGRPSGGGTFTLGDGEMASSLTLSYSGRLFPSN